MIRLLTRLLRKLRHILRRQQKDSTQKDLTEEEHLSQLFISKDFIKTILCDMDTFKREDESQFSPTEKGEKKLLYGEYLQQAVEFMMTLIIPVDPNYELKSYHQLLSIESSSLKSLQDWLNPLLKTSVFMHHFNHDLKYLPVDLLNEIHV